MNDTLQELIRPKLSQQEEAMSFAQYYDLPFQILDPLKWQILHNGPLRAENVTRVEHAFDLIQPSGYAPGSDFGYCMMEDGSGFVATYTVFHHCTVEMIDWWFEWLNVPPSNMPEDRGNIKYKVWCPYGHFDHRLAPDQERQMVPCATEALDFGLDHDPLDHIYMHPVDPVMLHVPQEKMDAMRHAGCTVGITCETFDYPGMHFCLNMKRPLPDGSIECIGREWIGYGVRDGQIVRVEETPVEEAFLRKVVIHSASEMQHLDVLLPLIYDKYKDLPMDAPL